MLGTRVFQVKRNELTQELRKLHNDELRVCFHHLILRGSFDVKTISRSSERQGGSRMNICLEIIERPQKETLFSDMSALHDLGKETSVLIFIPLAKAL